MSSVKGIGAAIDWSGFDSFPEFTCHCSCGATYRSHARSVIEERAVASRKPCPSCGSSRPWKASAEPEEEKLEAGDVGKVVIANRA